MNPSPPPDDEADLAEFVRVINGTFGERVPPVHGPAGGFEWSWPRRGLWRLTAGALLDPDPVVAGPAGEWRIARADHAGARFALLLLAAADGLPDGVAMPATGVAAVPGPARRPSPRPVLGGRPPSWEEVGGQPPAPAGLVPIVGGYPYGQPLADVPLPAAERGPGAAYAPEVVAERRPHYPPADDPTRAIAGSDLWPADEPMTRQNPDG